MMKRLAEIVGVSLLALCAAACGTGSVGDDGLGDDGTVQDEITCMAHFTITGGFQIGDPQPAEISGCWPVGTWTFSGNIGTNTCTQAPTFLSQYQFRVDRDVASQDPDYTFLYTYVTDPNDIHADMKVSSIADGCEGSLMVYSADGLDVFNFKPALHPAAPQTLDGQGDYEVHTTDQRPSLMP